MKRILLPLTLLLTAIFLCASCLNSDEDELVYYQDTAISSFSLGTLNRYITGTAKDGITDSIYKTTVTGSNYKFYIDQDKCEIYNPDSLPVGTDCEHVLCNISSKNSGAIFIRNIDSDTLKYYSSTDSIDFTVPREIRAYPNYIVDTTLYRKYTVRVNVHKEVADSFKWNLKTANGDFAGLKAMKSYVCNGHVYVFGTDGSKTKVFCTEESDGGNWTALAQEFDADAYKNVAVKSPYIYIRCNDGKLMKTADGVSWEKVADVAFDRLVGAGSKKLYAFAGEKSVMVSDDDGKTWTDDKIDEARMLLPTSAICFSTLPLKTDKNAERLFVTGYNASATQWNAASVWSKIEEYSAGSEAHSWIYYGNEADRYALPRFISMNVLSYDDVLIAMGSYIVGDIETEPYSVIYASNDNGLTWHSSDTYKYPSDFDSAATYITTVADSSNHLWIICGGTGQVWCGRLNRLGWER